MERVKLSILTVLIFIVLTQTSFTQKPDNYAELYKFYKTHYNFYSIPDTVYTIESELKLPEGYNHPKEFELTLYSDWVSQFPLWHKYKSIGNWRKQKEKDATEISRGIHLPWVGRSFRDFAIPVRMLGEFYFQKDSLFSLKISAGRGGEPLEYEKWLENKVALSSRGEIIYKPDVTKDNTEQEYYTFLNYCMEYVSYQGLVNSSDSVEPANIKPGDMFVAWDESGKKGAVYVILHLIFNDNGDTLYLVGTGCPEACDFHIPLKNNDQDYPWLSIDEIKEFQSNFKYSGFFRFKSLQ